VHETIEVQAPREDVFRYWSNFENFPNFMQNVEEVKMSGQNTSNWTVKGPLDKSVEFDARTTEMDPNRSIGQNHWRRGHDSGEARFEEVSPGRTCIDVTMNFPDPPGKVGEVAANLLSNPDRNLKEGLENFARIGERGELGGPDAKPLAALPPTDYRLT